MLSRKFSRRKFLRISGVTAVGAFTNLSLQASAQSDAAPVVVLNGDDADVWAWEKTVSGQVTDAACDTVTVKANETSLEVAVSDSQFSINVPIVEGANQVTATCEEAGVTSEPLMHTGKLRDVPFSDIAVTIDGTNIVLDGSGSRPSEKSASPITTFIWTARADNPAEVSLQEPADGSLETGIQVQRLVLNTPAVDGEYYFSLEVTDEQGRTDKSTTYFSIVDGQPVMDDWATENTDWVENTVVYGVITRNFGSQGFDSIVERLDSLKDLGINALWLAPINKSPPGDYGYAVVDYFELDRRYGDKEEFRRMVQEAHARDIRVLMDFVPNHSSEMHPYFLDAVNNGQQSPYWNFYDRDDSGFYTYYFDWTHLPNLNYENPEVRRWMLEAFAYWVREFDVDGFRVDVAWGIRERRPDFWPEWRRTLKRIKPDLLLLAEASARDDFYFTNGFDAAYDWTSQLGHWAWELVFEDEELLTFNLNSALTSLRQGFHPDALIFRFLNNNDTGPRFITKYGLDMTRVATALLLTLPGIPCIYTGDEMGEAFQPYFDPAPLTWVEQYEGLRDYHKHLITLRRTTPSLHSRFWTIVNVEPRKQVYGYVRHLGDNSEPLLVLLNFFDQPAEVEVALPDTLQSFAAATSYQDLVTGDTVSAVSTTPFKIAMPPYSAMILKPASQ
jgi:cyclomaltodextrinase / maltogenic alpha-amylase / neopullulanase